MGEFMQDHDIFIDNLLELLNIRFAPSEGRFKSVSGIVEMADLQKKFKIFSEGHSFRDCVAVLNLAGNWNWTLKRRWYKLLDYLSKVPSDQKGQNGSERIVAVIKASLESKPPTPVHFTSHHAKTNSGVMVTPNDQAIFYMKPKFTTISLPMRPRE